METSARGRALFGAFGLLVLGAALFVVRRSPWRYGGAARTWMELLYLSVAVLSSVALSDILPATPMARALVMIESFVGVLYIALVVSRLISISVLERKNS